jgi:hypothetical protein
MIPGWTVRNANDDVLTLFTSPSPFEVARKVVPTHDDAFRLRLSSSYRELMTGLRCRSWNARNCQIVRVVNARGARRTKAARFPAQDDELASGCPL